MTPSPPEVRITRSLAEIEAGYDLAARVFGPNYFEAREANRAVSSEIEPIASPRDGVVAVEDGSVIGFIRLVPRRLRFGRDRFGVIGITSVAVAPDHRGRHIGGALVREAMQEGRRRADDLAVLFARRAVDGWYPQFGFLGIGQHAGVAVPVPAAPRSQKDRSRLEEGFRPSRAADYARAYASAWRDVPGAFERPRDWWQRAGARLAARKHAAFFTLRGGAGYALIEHDHVLELAARGSDAPAAVAAILDRARSLAQSSVTFHLHPRHAAFSALCHLNHTVSIRRAWDGGHMAAPLTRSAARRLRAHGIGDAPARSASGNLLAWPVWSALDEF